MKVLLTLMALGLVSGATYAEQEVDEILEANPNGRVSVSNTAGDVIVRGWSRNEVRVQGELGDSVDELEIESDRDEISIIVRVPRNSDRKVSTDLTISVPQGSSLRVGTVSADIEVSGVLGALNLNTVSGDIDSEIFAADAELQSVSGDIEVQGDDQETDIEMASVSGDVEAQNIAGKASFESVTGDLAVIDSSFERIDLNTTNGDIAFRATLTDGGRMRADTINGSVDINFEGPVSARFNIETFNGSIDNCFGPEAIETSKYTPGSELVFNEGSGAGRVDITTLNGRIRLCKD